MGGSYVLCFNITTRFGITNLLMGGYCGVLVSKFPMSACMLCVYSHTAIKPWSVATVETSTQTSDVDVAKGSLALLIVYFSI